MSGRVSVVGGRVVSPGGVVVDGAVEIDAGRVVAVGAGRGAPTHGAVVDAGGGWIVPGFLDLQVNGGAGVDVTSAPERIGELAADLVAQGVTAFLPTLVTAPASRRATALSVWTSIALPPGAATPLGLHFEGPRSARHTRTRFAERRHHHRPRLRHTGGHELAAKIEDGGLPLQQVSGAARHHEGTRDAVDACDWDRG